MTGNIVLIGFMGVGKGRTARMLAEKSERFAVDCDDLLESYTNMKVKKIFKKHSESYFRALERRVAVWLADQVHNTVISTGGGFLKVPNLSEIGKVVYLHAEFEQIVEAIYSHPNAKKKIKKRPLLNDMDAVKKLFDERLPLYRKVSDYEVQVGGRSIDDVTDDILKYLLGIQGTY